MGAHNSRENREDHKLNSIEKNGIRYWQLRSLAKCEAIQHAISSRLDSGGGSMDLSLRTAGSVETAEYRRKRILSSLGLQDRRLVAGRQVHSDGIEIVSTLPGKEAGTYSFPDTDALITGLSGVALFSMHADCVPIFLFDPATRTIALAHAGWKGTVLEIGKKTVLKMKDALGVAPEHIKAGIGPSIGPDCYQVGPDVYEEARHSLTAAVSLFQPVADGKWHFNLWAANWQSLVEAGVRPCNIEISGVCTHCHSSEFFSHRAEKGQAGRFGAFLALV